MGAATIHLAMAVTCNFDWYYPSFRLWALHIQVRGTARAASMPLLPVQVHWVTASYPRAGFIRKSSGTGLGLRIRMASEHSDQILGIKSCNWVPHRVTVLLLVTAVWVKTGAHWAVTCLAPYALRIDGLSRCNGTGFIVSNAQTLQTGLSFILPPHSHSLVPP